MKYTVTQHETLTFVKLVRVGKWYDFYTDDGKKYSTQYPERAAQVKLNATQMYNTKYDYKNKEHRIMGTTMQNGVI